VVVVSVLRLAATLPLPPPPLPPPPPRRRHVSEGVKNQRSFVVFLLLMVHQLKCAQRVVESQQERTVQIEEKCSVGV